MGFTICVEGWARTVLRDSGWAESGRGFAWLRKGRRGALEKCGNWRHRFRFRRSTTVSRPWRGSLLSFPRLGSNAIAFRAAGNLSASGVSPCVPLVSVAAHGISASAVSRFNQSCQVELESRVVSALGKPRVDRCRVFVYCYLIVEAGTLVQGSILQELFLDLETLRKIFRKWLNFF